MLLYKFGGDGSIDMEMEVVCTKDLERYGFTWKLTEGIDGIEMYAKGPHENYCGGSASLSIVALKKFGLIGAVNLSSPSTFAEIILPL